MALLAAFSMPVLAASGISQSCEDSSTRAAERTAQSAMTAKPAGDHEPLVVMKAEGSASGIDPSRDLGTMLGDDYDQDRGTALPRHKEAVAEALERRRNGRMSATSDENDLAELPPSIDTALPGIGDAESLIYRREMYRTDI